MRTFSATFLLIILLAPLSGGYIWLSLKKITLKSQVKQRMIDSRDIDEFLVLKFSTQEAALALDWEHSGEFEYKGEMYDVIQSTITTDSASYWVWWDAEETELNRELKLLVDKSLANATNQGEHHFALKFQYSQCYTVPNFYKLSVVSLKDSIIWWNNNQHDYPSLTLSPNSPPPKYC